MVNALSAALLLAAASASAAPLALPSFEEVAVRMHSTVRTLRAEAAQTRGADAGRRIQGLAWDLSRATRELERLRTDLRFLISRVDARDPRRTDPNLSWDLRRLDQDLQQLQHDARWRLGDLRAVSSTVTKDPALVGPAKALAAAAHDFRYEANWFVTESRFDALDLMRAGFALEAVDLQRVSRDADQDSRDLESESDRLLAKVR